MLSVRRPPAQSIFKVRGISKLLMMSVKTQLTKGSRNSALGEGTYFPLRNPTLRITAAASKEPI